MNCLFRYTSRSYKLLAQLGKEMYTHTHTHKHHTTHHTTYTHTTHSTHTPHSTPYHVHTPHTYHTHAVPHTTHTHTYTHFKASSSIRIATSVSTQIQNLELKPKLTTLPLEKQKHLFPKCPSTT